MESNQTPGRIDIAVGRRRGRGGGNSNTVSDVKLEG